LSAFLTNAQIANCKWQSLQLMVEHLGVKVQEIFEKQNAQYVSDDIMRGTQHADALLTLCVTEVLPVMANLVKQGVYELFAVPWDAKVAPPLDETHGPLCLITDDCQDVSVKEQMAIVLRAVVKGRVVEKFMGLVELPDQKADTIYKALVKWCADKKIDRSRIVALGSDGVSTWTGAKTGVFVQWQHEFPMVTHLWCTCHKLALVAKHAAGSVRDIGQWFNSILDSIYGLFCQSSPRTATLKDIQLAMGDPVLKICRSCDTRWLSRQRVCECLYKTLAALIGYLILDAYSPTCSDKAKVPGLRDAICDWEFIATLSLMCDCLPIFGKVFKLFQEEDMDWFRASKDLAMMREELVALKETDGTHMQNLDDFIKDIERKVKDYGEAKSDEVERLLNEESVKRPRGWGAIDLEFKRFKIEQEMKTKEKWTRGTRRAWIQALVDEFDARFSEAAPGIAPKLHSLFSLDQVPLLGKDKAAELKAVHTHFKSILQESFEEIAQQYGSFCSNVTALRKRAALNTTPKMLHEWLTSFNAECFPGLARLITISLTIPVGTAEAERSFSRMNAIKDDERARLGEDMLENLMFISLHGAAVQDFPFDKAVYIWYTAGSRREKISEKFLDQMREKLFPVEATSTMDTGK
jgi:hypothetical protein